MIRTVMLTHRYTDAITSAIVCLFFRMAGIYVVERYLDFDVDLRTEMIEFDISPVKNQEILCDAEIALFSKQSRRMEYLESHTNRSKLVDICCLDVQGSNQNERYEDRIVKEILEKLKEKGLLEGKQYFDLLNLKRAFVNSDYVRTIMLSKYFFVIKDEQWTKAMIEKYRRIIWELQREDYEFSIDVEGDIFSHTKFAVINTAFEANLYCARNGNSPVYSNREIMDIATTLKKQTGNLLERSIETLLAQVEVNLLKDRSNAYQRMTELCRNDASVNAYVYFLKGNFWYSEENYERAAKFYADAIARFPEYYRAWYQLGNCFYKQGKIEWARKAFSNVIKVLTVRYEKNVMRPMEIEYLYRACIWCGKIQESYVMYSSALVYYGMAKSVWYSIETSDFFKYLIRQQTTGIISDLISQIKSKFDINDLERKIQRCKDYLGA